jgi:hypothetical protein
MQIFLKYSIKNGSGTVVKKKSFFFLRFETNVKPIKIYAPYKSRGGEKILWRYWGKSRGSAKSRDCGAVAMQIWYPNLTYRFAYLIITKKPFLPFLLFSQWHFSRSYLEAVL